MANYPFTDLYYYLTTFSQQLFQFKLNHHSIDSLSQTLYLGAVRMRNQTIE